MVKDQVWNSTGTKDKQELLNILFWLDDDDDESQFYSLVNFDLHMMQ